MLAYLDEKMIVIQTIAGAKTPHPLKGPLCGLECVRIQSGMNSVLSVEKDGWAFILDI